jgi:hypothetical protein
MLSNDEKGLMFFLSIFLNGSSTRTSAVPYGFALRFLGGGLAAANSFDSCRIPSRDFSASRSRGMLSADSIGSDDRRWAQLQKSGAGRRSNDLLFGGLDVPVGPLPRTAWLQPLPLSIPALVAGR